jgi:hypothetical protein
MVAAVGLKVSASPEYRIHCLVRRCFYTVSCGARSTRLAARALGEQVARAAQRQRRWTESLPLRLRSAGSGTMKHSALVLCIIAEACLSGCSPSALKELPLTPSLATGPSFMTLDAVVPLLEGINPSSKDMDLFSRVAVIGGRDEDPFAATLSLHEYHDILYLDVWLYNRSESPIELTPDLAVLVDGIKTQLRPLQAHEAANLLLAQRSAISPYQPKKQYRVETYDYGTYSRSTVREVEAGGLEGLGPVIANLILQSRNRKLSDAAAGIYALGLVPGMTLASDASIRFALTWLNSPTKAYPLELRLPSVGYRVLFNPPHDG